MPSNLSRLNSREAVQAALDEFDRLGRDAFLAKYGYGKARSYFVLNPRTGTWCDSKAIAGVAVGYQQDVLSFPLAHSDFSGGEAAVGSVLSGLGFEIANTKEPRSPSPDWSDDEVALVVSDYLAMLTLELTGQPYNKATRRRALQARLSARSEASIEFKHGNISAVMIQLGFPYLRGYKPRANFQKSLVDAVTSQVQKLAVLDEAAESAVQRPAVEPDISDFAALLTKAPDAPREWSAREESPSYLRGPIRRDYLEREARNRSLGQAGELLALRFEQWRLERLGAEHLAKKVEHVATTQGDGLGFDILSFEPDGRERYVEVKTTAFGQKTPFFVSANEARFARDKAGQFRLYRFYEFRSSPRMFELAGAIEDHCRLDPSTYSAHFQ